jgi:hypothetical protein
VLSRTVTCVEESGATGIEVEGILTNLVTTVT